MDERSVSGGKRNQVWCGVRAMTVLVAALAVGLPALVVFGRGDAAANVPADGPPRADKRLIEVDGIARMDVPPDLVDLTITLEGRAKSPSAAARALKKRSETLVTALTKAGLPGRDLALSHLRLSPRYEHRRAKRVFDGYAASVTLVATLRDLDRITEFVQVAADADARNVSTRFRTSRATEVKKEVREMALKAAQAKAHQMAAIMGVKVGPVLTIRESGAGGLGSGYWHNWANENRIAPRQGAQSDAPALPDTLPYTLTVHVSFAIL